MFVVGETVTTILVNTFQSALFVHAEKIRLEALDRYFRNHDFPFHRQIGVVKGVLVQVTSEYVTQSLIVVNEPVVKKRIFFMFQFVFKFFYFPPVRAITGKFDSFSASSLHHGVCSKDSMKILLEWNEKEDFSSGNRRWALRQSFEMQSTLRKKCRALRSSVRDSISIYKGGEAKACL